MICQNQYFLDFPSAKFLILYKPIAQANPARICIVSFNK